MKYGVDFVTLLQRQLNLSGFASCIFILNAFVGVFNYISVSDSKVGSGEAVMLPVVSVRMK